MRGPAPRKGRQLLRGEGDLVAGADHDLRLRARRSCACDSRIATTSLDLERCSLRWRALRLPAAGSAGSAVDCWPREAPPPAAGATRRAADWQMAAPAQPGRRRDDRTGGARSAAAPTLEMGDCRRQSAPLRERAATPKAAKAGDWIQSGAYGLRFDAATGSSPRSSVDGRALPLRGPAWPRGAASQVRRNFEARGQPEPVALACSWRLRMSPECWRAPATTARCARSPGVARRRAGS